jgi:hypothetical protein
VTRAVASASNVSLTTEASDKVRGPRKCSFRNHVPGKSQPCTVLLTQSEQAATSRFVVRVRTLEVKLAVRAAALAQAAAIDADA